LEGITHEVDRVDDRHIPGGHWIVLLNDVGNVDDESFVVPSLFVQLLSNLYVDWRSGVNRTRALFNFEKKKRRSEMKKMMEKVYTLAVALLLLFPREMFAHGTEEEHQKEGFLGNYVFIGTVILFALLLLFFILANIKTKQLNNAKKQADREKRKQLTKTANGLKWGAIGSFVAVVISGIVAFSSGSDFGIENATGANGNTSGTRNADEVTIHHGHGMSYSPDGSNIFFAVHDGLRVYEKGQWKIPAGEQHDYMGFSMVDDGFYSSGHPAPGSGKKNPLGIVKSTDEGRSFETLALYGQVDFHGMSVGYKSHAIYVFNPEPNAKMKTTGLHYSTDEAKNWIKSEAKGLQGEPASLAAHPTDSAVVAVGTDKGIFVSKNFGQQFEKVGPEMQTTAIFFNAQGALFAGGANKQLTLTRIDLESKQAENMNTPSISEDAIAIIAQNPVNEQEMAIMTFKKDVYITSDLGKSWMKIADEGKGTSAQK
jgi:hypothetical protein